MTGKHLYKKTSQLMMVSLIGLFFTLQASASNMPTDRHSLLVEFLRLTDKKPQWQDPQRLRSLEFGVKNLLNDGLEPSNYQLKRIQQLINQFDDQIPEISAAEDAVISGAYLEAIADLMLGRTRNSNVERYLNYQNQQPNAFAAIVQLAVTYLDEPSVAFDKARPQVQEYQSLRTAHQRILEQIQASPSLPLITPDRPSLRLGVIDPRVTLLRRHLGVEIPEIDSDVYDQDLMEAVRQFQSQQGLEADGIAGPQTFAHINRTPEQDLVAIRVNLERWRRVNLALTDSRVIANIAGATIHYYQDNQLEFYSRTQVGRRDRPTPLMISEISHFTLNPTWTIPPTIYRNDKLPAIQNDPSYIQSNRLTVLDTQGNRLDPDLIDWDNPGSILLRQSSGPHNALGQVVIRFPNRQSIYLHDTPNQRLFDRNQRYFSSGCIRVEDATLLVNKLLEATHSAQASQFDSLLSSGSTRNINIGQPVTIVLGYWTVNATPAGDIQVFTDIYGLDSAMLSALNG
ncbi:MAG: murein L,D-transpeptidase [Oceanospirillales bacterium]|nr:MAG: murein L,D-transpeptidase [Oceanospirillales bacterium]